MVQKLGHQEPTATADGSRPRPSKPPLLQPQKAGAVPDPHTVGAEHCTQSLQENQLYLPVKIAESTEVSLYLSVPLMQL